MKKPALVLAIAIASTAAQAQIVNDQYTGALGRMYFDSAFTAAGWTALDVQNSYLVYTVDLSYDAGSNAVLGLDVTLDGLLTNVGTSMMPQSTHQQFTFTNAVYSLDVAKVSQNNVGFTPDFSQLVGDIDINGGVFPAIPGSSASTLTSGNVGCIGTQICDAFDVEALVSGLSLDFVLDAGNGFAEMAHSVGISFTSQTGSTMFAMTAVPVPAAAWLFGSALVGLAGFKRSRK